jgi:hypothetical protein
MDIEDDPSDERLYNAAFEIADAMTRRNDNPFVLLVAAHMLCGSLVNAIDRLMAAGELGTAGAPFSRADITRMFRDVMGRASQAGKDGLQLAQSLFSLPEPNGGAAVAMLAIRALCGTDQDAEEAVMRLAAATALIAGPDVQLKSERAREILNLARQFLATTPEVGIRVNAMGGDA